MPTLTVTSRGQITLRKEVLAHLGVPEGGKIEVDLLPNGGVRLRPQTPTLTFADIAGSLKGKTNGARLTIDEINEAIAEGWASGGDPE